mgnify:CR=1 FL=1
MNFINKKRFNKLINGKQVGLFTLQNNKGTFCEITNYGGILTALHVPDKNGKVEDVTLGFDSLAKYQEKHGQELTMYSVSIEAGTETMDFMNENK